MGSRSRDKGGGECWGPGGRTFVTPLRYTNCSFGAGLGRNFGCCHPIRAAASKLSLTVRKSAASKLSLTMRRSVPHHTRSGLCNQEHHPLLER